MMVTISRFAYLFACAALCYGSLVPVTAQDRVKVFGTVRDHDTDELMKEAFLRVTNVYDTLTTAVLPVRDGKYDFSVDYDREWLLTFKAEGYVQKSLLIDVRNVPMADRSGGHGMNIDMAMLAGLEGVDYSVLTEQPFGIARYDSREGVVMWDMMHVQSSRAAQLRLIASHEKKRKEITKESLDADIMVTGEIRVLDTKAPSGPGVVHAVDTILNEHLFAAVIDSAGRFALKIPYVRHVRLQFVVPGAVQRHAMALTTHVPAEIRRASQSIVLDIRTIRAIEGGAYDALRAAPCAEYGFDRGGERFMPDKVVDERSRQLEKEALRKQKALIKRLHN